MPTIVVRITRGEDRTYTFTPSAPFDLTGATLTLQIGRQPDKTPVLTLTTGGGGLVIVAPATNGVFTAAITDTQSEALSTGLFYFEVWKTNAGDEFKITEGIWIVSEPIRDPL